MQAALCKGHESRTSRSSFLSDVRSRLLAEGETIQVASLDDPVGEE